MSTIHITKSAAAVIVVSEEERRITVGIGMSHRERNCLSLIPISSSVRVLPAPCLTVKEHLSPRLRILTSVPSRVTARYPCRISLLETDQDFPAAYQPRISSISTELSGIGKSAFFFRWTIVMRKLLG